MCLVASAQTAGGGSKADEKDAQKATVPAETKKVSAPDETKDETVVLSPFVVTTDEDKGYSTANSLSGFGVSTSLMKTPQTIQVANQQLLQDLGIGSGDLIAALEMATSSVVRRSYNNGDDQFSWGFRLTSTIRDGVPTGTANPLGVFYDIDRVEVIKGPAAAIFGQASSIGGVINYVPRAPSKKQKERVSFSYGSFNRKTAEAHAAGPVTDKFRYRFDLGLADNGDARRFGYYKDKFVGAGFEYDISKNILASFDMGYSKVDRATVWTIMDQSSTDKFARVDPRLGDDLSVNAPYDNSKSDREFASGKVYVTTDTGFSSLTAVNFYNLDLGLYRTQVNSIDATRRFLTRVTLFPFRILEHNLFVAQTFNQKFTTGWFKHSMNLSFDARFQHSKTATQTSYSYPTNFDLDNPTYPQDTVSQLIQGNPGVWALSRNRISGASFTENVSVWDDKINAMYTVRYNNQFMVTGFPFDTYASVPTDLTKAQTVSDGDVVTRRYALTYEPIKDIVGYYSMGEAFIFNGSVDYLQRPLVPSIGQNKEFGIKANFLNGAISITAAHADITVSNVRIVFIEGPDDPDPGSSAVKQGGTQTNKGYDIAVNVNKEFKLGTLTGIAGVYSGNLRDEKNLKVQHIVNNTANLFSSFRFRQGPVNGLFFGAGANFVGERVGPLLQAQAVKPLAQTRIAPYWKYKALVGYAYKKLSVQLNIDNIADTKAITSWESSLWAYTDPGRTYRLSASYTF